MSRVDVIVPCYRYAHFLRRCVESVLAQPVDLRVLIVDDASPDETFRIAAEIASRDPRVEVLTHKTDQGHIATFNDGLDWASGDYTLLISADDMLTPNALARAVAAMDANPDAGLVCGRVVRFTSDEEMPAASLSGGVCRSKAWRGEEWLEKILADPTDSLTSPEAVVRTCWYKRLGGYRADLPHTGDQEMWLRIAAHSDVIVLEADQAFYRVHANSMHLTRFGKAIVNLEQRDAAFRAFFETCGSRLSDRNRLEAVGSRGLATMALEVACGAFFQDDRETMRGLTRFALGRSPSIRRTPLYAKVVLMGLVGRRGWSALRAATFRPSRGSIA